MPQAPLSEARESAARSKSVREVESRVLTQSEVIAEVFTVHIQRLQKGRYRLFEVFLEQLDKCQLSFP